MHHILYIPGIGDDKALRLQMKPINRWPKKDIKVHVFRSDWHKKESTEAKYKRLQSLFSDILKQQHATMSVMGVSAGGPLAVRLCHDNIQKIHQIYLLVGKLRGSLGIGEAYQQKAPALKTCVAISEELLKKNNNDFSSKTTILWPLFDTLIPLDDMKVSGARYKRLPVIGHSIAIGYALYVTMPQLLRRLKKQYTSR